MHYGGIERANVVLRGTVLGPPASTAAVQLFKAVFDVLIHISTPVSALLRPDVRYLEPAEAAVSSWHDCWHITVFTTTDDDDGCLLLDRKSDGRSLAVVLLVSGLIHLPCGLISGHGSACSSDDNIVVDEISSVSVTIEHEAVKHAFADVASALPSLVIEDGLAKGLTGIRPYFRLTARQGLFCDRSLVHYLLRCNQ